MNRWTGDPDFHADPEQVTHDSDEWDGPRSCCAEFGAAISTERTGRIMRCPVCKYVWAVPFSAEYPQDGAA